MKNVKCINFIQKIILVFYCCFPVHSRRKCHSVVVTEGRQIPIVDSLKFFQLKKFEGNFIGEEVIKIT